MIHESWRQSAACRDRGPGLFFSTAPADEAAAKEVCVGCPVRMPCLWTAVDEGRVGVWGGTTEEERTPLAARLARRPGLSRRPGLELYAGGVRHG